MKNVEMGFCNNVQTDQSTESTVHVDSDTSTGTDCSEKFCSTFSIGDNLSETQVKELHQCIYDNRDVFVTDTNPNLGYSKLVEHEIHLVPGFVSKHQRPYRLPPDKKEVLRSQLDELLQQGVIAPVHEGESVPITSPIVLVAKRQKPGVTVMPGTGKGHLRSYRFCCDFRFLNAQTQDFRYNIPDIQDLTESFTNTVPKFITSIDMSSGFFQMAISKQSSQYTAFNTCFGTYTFLRLLMGLKTAPNSFQMLMDKVLHGLTFKSVLCYLDDVLITSSTFEQHIIDINNVLKRFRKATPNNAKELKRALGLLNWFRKYIPNFSAIASPLHLLLKKGVKFVWTSEHTVAFDQLKRALVDSDALSFPKFDTTFRIAVDTSSKGLGTCYTSFMRTGHLTLFVLAPRDLTNGSSLMALPNWNY